MNRIELIGKLIEQPEMKLPNDQRRKYLEFVLATKPGEFFHIEVRGAPLIHGDALALRKGDEILLIGKLCMLNLTIEASYVRIFKTRIGEK